MRERGLKQATTKGFLMKISVAPHAGAWIETDKAIKLTYLTAVAPHAGAWIETRKILTAFLFQLSLPMRERGLKHVILQYPLSLIIVAPHAGAWIETCVPGQCLLLEMVAPHAGAWIETLFLSGVYVSLLSLPMRERGLKRRRYPKNKRY